MDSEEKLVNMAGPAMRLMDEMTKDIKPENVLSEFVEHEFGGLFEGGNEMAAGFLVKMTIQEANEQPKVVLGKFLRFYNTFREFYVGLEKTAEMEKNPPVREEEEEEEETEETEETEDVEGSDKE